MPVPKTINPQVRERERGFTLVELMVVIVIIGLLATVVMVNVMPSQDKAMVTKAKADIATLEQAMEMYRLDNLAYPSGGDGLNALVGAPAGSQPGTASCGQPPRPAEQADRSARHQRR